MSPERSADSGCGLLLKIWNVVCCKKKKREFVCMYSSSEKDIRTVNSKLRIREKNSTPSSRIRTSDLWMTITSTVHRSTNWAIEGTTFTWRYTPVAYSSPWGGRTPYTWPFRLGNGSNQQFSVSPPWSGGPHCHSKPWVRRWTGCI